MQKVKSLFIKITTILATFLFGGSVIAQQVLYGPGPSFPQEAYGPMPVYGLSQKEAFWQKPIFYGSFLVVMAIIVGSCLFIKKKRKQKKIGKLDNKV